MARRSPWDSFDIKLQSDDDKTFNEATKDRD